MICMLIMCPADHIAGNIVRNGLTSILRAIRSNMMQPGAAYVIQLLLVTMNCSWIARHIHAIRCVQCCNHTCNGLHANCAIISSNSLRMVGWDSFDVLVMSFG